MDDPNLYAVVYVGEQRKFYLLADGTPSRGPTEENYVIHQATGKLWVENRAMLERLGAHLVAIPRSYLQERKRIF